MSADRRRLLFRSVDRPSGSTETEPESVFFDNPAFDYDDVYEKPKVHGKPNHVSWDIDEYAERNYNRKRPDISPRLGSRSSGFGSSFDSRASGRYDSQDSIGRPGSHGEDQRGKQNKSYSNYNGKYEDRNSNIVFDPGPWKKQTFAREPSWKKQYREGGAYYIPLESDDTCSSGYPSSGTYRKNGGRGFAGERRRSFSLSPQSSDERARSPNLALITESPRSRSPRSDRLTVEAAVHWPAGSAFRKQREQDDSSNQSSVTTSSTFVTTQSGHGRSPRSSSSSWRDNSSNVSIQDAFALQAKSYLVSRKLNDTISTNVQPTGALPLLSMPPGTGTEVGLPMSHKEKDRAIPELVQERSSDYRRVRKVSETGSNDSYQLRRLSTITGREREMPGSSIFEDLNLTFREVSESEFDTEEEDLEGGTHLNNGRIPNGSAVIPSDHIGDARRDSESPLPITREDTEDMIVMIMSNRSPCVARFISFCGVFQMLCGFIVMMSGASGYLSNMSILNTGVTFNFPIGFYIGAIFAFSGGFGIKSSHTKRKCINIMSVISSACSLMASLFILVLIASPGAITFSCSPEAKGLFIFHLVIFTTEIIFAGLQCVMGAKSLLDSKRTAKTIRNRSAQANNGQETPPPES